MRFTAKRITSFQIIVAKQDAKIVLTRIYDSGNKYRFILNFVQSNMFPAQEHTQLRLKPCQRFNGRPLLRVASQRTQIFQNVSHNPVSGAAVLQLCGNILLDLR